MKTDSECLDAVKTRLLIDLLVNGINKVDGKLDQKNNFNNRDCYCDNSNYFRGGTGLADIPKTPNNSERRQKQGFYIKNYLTDQRSG